MMLDVPDSRSLDLLDIIKVWGRKELNTVRLVVMVVVVGVPVPVGSPEITDLHHLVQGGLHTAPLHSTLPSVKTLHHIAVTLAMQD